jgi:hypothetical protein
VHYRLAEDAASVSAGAAVLVRGTPAVQASLARLLTWLGG